ncbi:MAG: hypothetical protein ACFFG0_01185 [Candidatus Thorarchaeota archaeon]
MAIERITTHQSSLTFHKNKVEKEYLKEHEKNHLSSVKNELYCLSKFSYKNKKYSPQILSSSKYGYVIKRYDFSLGNTKRISEPHIRRLLFTCSPKEIIKQLNEIESILKKRGIVHKDINPGNFLFCEKEKTLKLIDFYWASTENINKEIVRGINGIYKKDPDAFNRIRKEIKEIVKKVKQEVDKSKQILSKLGEVYYDGSAKHKGKTYHPIDIPYFKSNLFHKEIVYEFNNIVSNIKNPIESVIDIGCAAGFYLFNFIRMFNIEKGFGFEADPVMLSFLKEAKNMFNLNELQFNNNVTHKTRFPKVDLVICMNVHMWLVKQFGRKADVIVANLIKNSEEMFFQTAHAESAGIYKVKWLKNKNDIQKYLEDLGGKKVSLIDTSKRGGLRYLFKVEDS